ncbi:MAG TPA: adenosylcobinamide amidohydrolase [Longimicrobiaceae bacterium]
MSVHVVREGRWLVARFAEPHAVLSWAVVGGGRRRAEAVAWHQVVNAELCPDTDPRELLRGRLDAAGLPDAVGLLTSASLDGFVDVEKESGRLAARCVATVGLGNALRAGDPPGVGSTIAAAKVGTINLLVRVSAPLTEEALAETLALAAEARTLAVLEAGVRSLRTGLPATGTGTDCIVVAAPEGGEPLPYAGKHTEAGHLVGAAVEETVRRGIEGWTRRQAAG